MSAGMAYEAMNNAGAMKSKLIVILNDNDMSIDELLQFYMGKNTPNRQSFIIDNLKVELDIVD